MYSAGDCIIIETDFYPDGSRRAHLFVVIQDVNTDGDMTILIPMDTIPEKGFYDKTTELPPGIHDFVKVPTYMNYNEGIVRSKNWIDQNGRKREPPVGGLLLNLIRDGISKTDHVPFDVYDAYLFGKMKPD